MALLSFLVPLVAVFTHILAVDAWACPADIPLSCQNSTAVQNTCCFITSGQLLQAQFWDVKPSTGPSDSWTIHGLWADNCDGSYPAACDRSRAYTHISDILTASGADDVLAYMKRYWKDWRGHDETLWEHEWRKHGTCISTLAPRCFSDYRPADEVAVYFSTTVSLFQTLPTHAWLAAAGITPSKSKRYRVSDIQAALRQQHGATVTLGCRGKTLNQVWYHFNVRGSLQDGMFFASEPSGTKSSCPGEVRYLPKSKAYEAVPM